MRKLCCCCVGLALAVTLLVSYGSSSTGKEEKKLDTKEILKKITLTKDRALASRLEATANNPTIPFGKKNLLELEAKNVEPEPVAKKNARGEDFAVGLSFTCDPRNLNKFTVDGAPLNAKRFSYSVDTISWQAGDGWPVYSTYCPNPGYSTSMYYPAAKIHQIVPSIDGQNYFVGCLQSGICESAAAGQICFAVNDNNYPDNRGYFVVTVYGIEQ